MMALTIVDLPSPLRPTKATLSPRPMVIDTSLNTRWSPYALPSSEVMTG